MSGDVIGRLRAALAGRFRMVIEDAPPPPVPPLVYVQHWFPELRGKVTP